MPSIAGSKRANLTTQITFQTGSELLGGGRKAIEHEMHKRGLQPLLPPLVPFRANDWPWKTDPTKGTGPATLEEVLESDLR
jgi:hypothetical protein